MFNKFFLLFGFIILLASNGYSKTNFYQVTGSISSVEVLKTYTKQKIPREEKKCSIQRVPVNQNAQKFGADNFIGALIGGAIGNQIGSGGGKSGSAALGALIGSEVVRSEKAAANESYMEKEVCSIQKVFYTETKEQVSGYRLNIEVDGEMISFTSNKSYNPGDLITLTKKISYSLN
jgi:uncharacterized protein YcfJ